MSRRTRSLLLDNTGGRMFTNVTRSTDATADKVIAGTRPTSKSITQPSTRNAFTFLNIGGTTRGLVLSTRPSLLTRIDLSVSTKPIGGAGIKIIVRQGTSNSNAVGLPAKVAEITLPSGQQASLRR